MFALYLGVFGDILLAVRVTAKRRATVVTGWEVAVVERGNRMLCFYHTTTGAAGDAEGSRMVEEKASNDGAVGSKVVEGKEQQRVTEARRCHGVVR